MLVHARTQRKYGKKGTVRKRKTEQERLADAVMILTLRLIGKHGFNYKIIEEEMRFIGRDGVHFFFHDARTESPVIVDVRAQKAMLYRNGLTWDDQLIRFYQLSTEEYRAVVARWEAEDLAELDSTDAVLN